MSLLLSKELQHPFGGQELSPVWDWGNGETMTAKHCHHCDCHAVLDDYVAIEGNSLESEQGPTSLASVAVNCHFGS